jgi:hypothetical protein
MSASEDAFPLLPLESQALISGLAMMSRMQATPTSVGTEYGVRVLRAFIGVEMLVKEVLRRARRPFHAPAR